MTCLISCSSKILLRSLGLLLLGLVLTGCSGLLRTTPEARLQARAVVAALPSPQVVGSGPISWTVALPAAFAQQPLRFELRDGNRTVVQVQSFEQNQSSGQTRWDWYPETVGAYQARVVVTAAAGEEVASRWSRPFVIVEALNLAPPRAQMDDPLMAGNADVPWILNAQGGVGDYRYRFELEHPDGRLESVQAGTTERWVWKADRPGSYRVRGLVGDERGNEAISPWSEPFLIAPVLRVEPPFAVQPAPQMADTGPFTWNSTSSGGVGERSVRFELETPDKDIIPVESGAASSWNWSPDVPGSYRVRAVVTDRLGNQRTSDWSQPYQIVPELEVAVPVVDRPAPQAALAEAIIWNIAVRGGVEPLSHYFELEKDGQLTSSFPLDTRTALGWRPTAAGSYRLRVRVVDKRGNETTGAWSQPYQVVPPLTIAAPRTAIDSPQMIDSVAVAWSVAASGGVGDISYRFELERDGKSSRTIATGSEASWTWQPRQAGTYRVRAFMTDSLGNQRLSAWSEPFVVTEHLAILGLSSDRSSPQTAATVPIRWEVKVRGGVAPYSYQFELAAAEEAGLFVQQGPQSEWSWRPELAGRYKVRASVSDARGNRQQGKWSDPYRIAPPLQINPPETRQSGSQFLVGTRIDWQVEAGGGIAPLRVVFAMQEAGESEVTEVEKKVPGRWRWQPRRAGHYRVRATLIDALGNRLKSPWSPVKEIRSELALDILQPDLPAPQAALRDTIVWRAETNGGLLPLTYEFRLRQDGGETLVQRGSSAQWQWRPRRSGSYQVQVRVEDASGTARTSAWSPLYPVTPAVKAGDLVAFLPPENLSGQSIPAAQISERYREKLREAGLELLDPQLLERFMHRHRVRYTGGIGSRVAKALREEEGVTAVFVTSVESYSDGAPPQLALTSRLVLCEDLPRIAWMDAIGLNGDDTPGLLGLKRVIKSDELLDLAVERLTTALSAYLQKGEAPATQPVKALAPNDYYRASDFVAAQPYQVAVVPFLNRYARRNAGFVVPLQLVNLLQGIDTLEVFEPGLVREQLLNYRLIMQAGPSLAVADVLASETTLNADLILSGYVFDYQDDTGNPKIDFSTRLFSGPERKIVWWSRSYAAGDDGVIFYDVGRVRSAQVLLKQMVESIGDLLFFP